MSASATPGPSRVPTPLDDGRLDVLLVGGDAGPGRWSLRTDTLMVLSVDVASGEAALFSIPIVLWSPIGRDVFGFDADVPFGLREDVFTLLLSLPVSQ